METTVVKDVLTSYELMLCEPTKSQPLARTQIHKFTNGCFPSLHMFFTFNTVLCVFVLSKKYFLVNTQIHTQ
jgi:hypothetical protein